MVLQRQGKSDQKPGNLQSILDIISEENWKELNMGPHKNIIVVLGNSQADKTLLIQLLAGNLTNVVGHKIQDFPEEFTFEIVGNDSNSDKKFPKFIVDSSSNSTYYDCPSFESTTPEEIILTNFVIKKVLNFAEQIKLIFVVNYNLVMLGESGPEFVNFIKHLIMLVKNVKKFKNSAALFITDVDNVQKKKGAFISHEIFVQKIAAFIKQAISTVREEFFGSNEESKMAMLLLNILLNEKNGAIANINILTKPTTEGTADKMPIITNCIKTISNTLQNSLKFVEVDSSDFDYSLPENAWNYVGEELHKISENVTVNIANIGNEVKNFYVLLEKQKLDLQAVYERFENDLKSFSETKAMIENSKTLKAAIEKIVAIVKALNINISRKCLYKLLDETDYLDFFQNVSNGKIVYNTYEWSKGFEELLAYFEFSTRTYFFFWNLLEKLRKYKFQKRLLLYQDVNISELNEYLANNQTFMLRETKLHKFLHHLNVDQSGEVVGYDNVKHDILSTEKVETLIRILTFGLKHKTTISCIRRWDVDEDPKNYNILEIAGRFVMLSDFDFNKTSEICSVPIRVIKILALDTVFIDDDSKYKFGPIEQVLIIAPVWSIFNEPTFNLNGTDGICKAPAKNGTKSGEPGKDGKPGAPGGPAAFFFGIGDEFSNTEELSIFAIGGTGATGQQGGNGTDGINGKDPYYRPGNEEKNVEDVWRNENLEIKALIVNDKNIAGGVFVMTTNYTIFGPGQPGGRGGHGGVGGIGGFQGKVNVINLNENALEFDVQVRNGTTGKGGEGGLGGKGGLNGRVMDIQCKTHYEPKTRFYCLENTTKYSENPKMFPVKNGSFGYNKVDIQNPEDNTGRMNELGYFINLFKYQILEAIDGHLKQNYLKLLFDKLETSPSVKKLNSVKILMNEYDLLNKQLESKKNKKKFTGNFQSLSERVKEYYENFPNSKKVLVHLMSSIQTTIYTLDEDTCDNTETNPELYLQTMASSITSMKNKTSRAISETNFSQLGNRLKNAIKNVETLISTEIVPKIDQSIKKNYELVKQTFERISDQQLSTQNIKYQQEKLIMSNIINGKLLNTLKMTAQHLITLTKVSSQVINYLENQLLSVKENSKSYGQRRNNNDLLKPITTSKLLLDNSKMLQTSRNDYKMRLAYAIVQIDTFFKNNKAKYTHLQIFRENSRQIRRFILNEENNKFDVTFLNKMNLLKSNITIQALESNHKIFNVMAFLEIVFHFPNITLFSQIKNSDKITKVVSKALTKVKNNKMLLDKFENTLLNTINDVCRRITASLNDNDNGITDGHVSLGFDKWNVVQHLKSIKSSFNLISQRVHFNGIFSSLIENIEEILMSIIDVYDKMNNYYRTSHFVLWSNTTFYNLYGLSTKITGDINNVESITKSRIILNQYQKAVAVFRQSTDMNDNFFIDKDISKSPFYFNTSYDSFITNINLMIQKLKQSNAPTFRTVDPHELMTFLVWKNSDYQDVIASLLQGEKIIVKANILNGVGKNGVTFKEIRLRLKTSSINVQSELDNLLLNYNVILTYFGASYFQCGNKFYVSFNNPISLTHGFGKNRTEFAKSNLMLSPYAMWMVELNQIKSYNSTQLLKYQNDIDLKLEGVGKVINKIESCNTNLGNLFKVDDTIHVLDQVIIEHHYNLEEFQTTQSYTQKVRRRSVDDKLEEIYSTSEAFDNNKLFSRSSASSIKHSFFLNNIFSWIGKSIATLKSWTSDYRTGLSYMSKMSFSYLHELSPSIDLKNSDINNTLIFADFLVRKFTRQKARNKTINNEYHFREVQHDNAQKLAYNYYYKYYSK